MATIPIEIILQDAEVPVEPTPESGEETNITVPETGTISDVGSNSGGIGSSVSSIILPATILVLALGAIVALLVRRQQKRKKSNTGAEGYNAKLSKKEKLSTAASGTIAILAATVLVGNLVIPATNAATSVEPGAAELETEDKITIIATREQGSNTITATVKDTSYATANLDFGYKVTASMAKGTTTANLYLDGNTDSPYYIAPVSDGILTDNTWGYTLSEPTEESSYQYIPLSTKPTNIVKEVAKTVEDTAVDIYYTVQIDKDMPNGTYTGELEYTIAPAIEYMQDFSTLTSAEKTATLARMPEGKQYILKDNRDENSYYISKLKDNNVWMTQNLDFDIVNGGADMNSTNTDVPEDWADAGKLTNTYKNTNWDGSETTPESYDPGNRYWNGTIRSPGGTIDSETSTEPSDIPSGGHYHIGNYYNWTIATAMSDSSIYTTPTDIDQSICPAGWRMPTYEGGGSYQTLITAQNLSSGHEGNIQNSPTNFTYSGTWNGDSSDVGGYGYYWANRTNAPTETGAMYFAFYGAVDPHFLGSRSNGYSIRCVAR